MPAAEGTTYQQSNQPPSKEGKEKKEKPKSKTAQQVIIEIVASVDSESLMVKVRGGVFKKVVVGISYNTT